MTTIVTHDSKFHADDIFAVATLVSLYPDATIVRSREQTKIDGADIVVDTGLVYDPEKRRFDHHQPGGAGSHESGVPYASFGLVWKEYGERLAGDVEAARIVEDKLVTPVDAIDNGVALSTPLFGEIDEYRLDDLFGSFVDYTKGDGQIDESFSKLVLFAKDIIQNEIRSASLRLKARAEVERAYNEAPDKRVIVLEHSMPWMDTLLEKPEPLYVIFEVAEGKWYVRGIPPARHSFDVKKPFPESWGGKSGEELEAASGVKGAVFAHKGLYLAGADSKEAALALAQIALNS
ncbi:MAG: metal-dependent protein hydrolase [Parcubacteria group bacterium]|nr:metal-dependent protein hydrolase [Parcubacteria group bacterium]